MRLHLHRDLVLSLHEAGMSLEKALETVADVSCLSTAERKQLNNEVNERLNK